MLFETIPHFLLPRRTRASTYYSAAGAYNIRCLTPLCCYMPVVVIGSLLVSLRSSPLCKAWGCSGVPREQRRQIALKALTHAIVARLLVEQLPRCWCSIFGLPSKAEAFHLMSHTRSSTNDSSSWLVPHDPSTGSKQYMDQKPDNDQKGDPFKQDRTCGLEPAAVPATDPLPRVVTIVATYKYVPRMCFSAVALVWLSSIELTF